MLPFECPINPAGVRTWMSRSLAVVLLLALAWGAAPTELHADTHTVTTNADSGAGSLRQAIADAASGDTITFSLTYPAVITLTSGELTINNMSLTIQGPGESQLTISGNYAGRVFWIHAGSGDTVTLSNLTIAGGRNSGSDGGCVLVFGGLAATLDHVTVRDCLVTSDYGTGGAIDSAVDGSLTLTYSSVISSQAVLGGGIYHNGGGSLTLTHSAVLSNTGAVSASSEGQGGGIWVQSSNRAILDHSRVENNRATGGHMSGPDSSLGGGIFAMASLTVDSSDIRFNQAGGSGGGISGVGWMDSVSMSITGTAIVGNLTNGGNAANEGGGLYLEDADAAITNTLISTNSAIFGGGIYASSSSVAIANSTLQYNAVTGYPSGTEGFGGGIVASGSTDVYVTNSTISNNLAQGNGGGIASDCADCSGYEISLVHATVSGNVADSDLDADGGDGGGIYIDSALGQQTNLTNTVVAGNDDRSTPGADDCSGTITSQGYNLVGDGTGCPHAQPGDLTTADPLLGPLSDNGGTTPTQALLSGSPAIDHIPNGTSGCGTSVTADQRYVPRPMGPGCDIGSFELSLPVLGVVKLADDGVPAPGQRVTYTIVVTNDGTVDALGAVISDTLPAGLSLAGPVGLLPPGAGTPGTPPVLVYNLTISASGRVTVTLPVTVAASGIVSGTLITNTASVTCAQLPSATAGSAAVTVRFPTVKVYAPLLIRR